MTSEFVFGVLTGIILWQLICTVLALLIDDCKVANFSFGLVGMIFISFCKLVRLIIDIYTRILYAKVKYNKELYITNELGEEKFIKKRHTHIYINKFNLRKYKIGEEFKDRIKAIDDDKIIMYRWLSLVDDDKDDKYCYAHLKEVLDTERKYIKEKFYIDKK